jgi:hypothetical protein
MENDKQKRIAEIRERVRLKEADGIGSCELDLYASRDIPWLLEQLDKALTSVGECQIRVAEWEDQLDERDAEIARLKGLIGSATDLCEHVLREDNDGAELFDRLTLSDENGKVRSYREWARRFIERAQ